MNKTWEIRRAIASILRDIHPRVYYERAPDRARFPYVVFLLTAFNDGELERFVLDVDGWDAPADADTTALEELMNAVDHVLHKRVVNVRPTEGSFLAPFQWNACDSQAGVSFVLYRDRRLVPEDDDARIRRRRYSYEVRTFEKRRDYYG